MQKKIVVDDLDELPTPEEMAEQHAEVLSTLHLEHDRWRVHAKVFARWIAKHDESLERALLEELADTNPRVLPFLIRTSVLAEQREMERLAIAAHPRQARNRARKKIERGLGEDSLSSLELEAWRAR